MRRDSTVYFQFNKAMKCRTWDILTYHDYLILRRGIPRNAYQFSRKFASDRRNGEFQARITLWKSIFTVLRTFVLALWIFSRHRAQRYVYTVNSTLSSTRGKLFLSRQITGFCAGRDINSTRAVVKLEGNSIRVPARVSNWCSLAQSDSSHRDLRFYKSDVVESVNEICTGHLKTSGFRERGGGGEGERAYGRENRD